MTALDANDADAVAQLVISARTTINQALTLTQDRGTSIRLGVACRALSDALDHRITRR